ncbi:4-hydroxythreonine-4-phosphate dehydrogenase PdxA [bacterium]|nr:4-hydroxythreonine-4-phosphate dehydrogenase PdxA [bacterium]
MSPDASNPVQIGLTIGDPGGIGPEVALKALAHWNRPGVEFSLIGPRELWGYHAGLLGSIDPELGQSIRTAMERACYFRTLDPGQSDALQIGRTNARHGAVAEGAIRRGVELCLAGSLDGIVTAPISKEGLKANHSPFPGHTEMLRELTGTDEVVMVLAGGGLRVGLVTIHVPLRRVPELVTPELVAQRGRIFAEFLKLLLDREPRIAVCGLNPHAGEGGMFGTDEEDAILPGIKEAERHGFKLDGPFPADTIFHQALSGQYDGVLAMYHDQGLVAVKTLAFDSGVNITAGLPMVRTSPDHGTAFNIAGEGVAKHDSVTSAIEMAVELAVARRKNA